MADINSVNLTGRLCANPELRQTQSGKKVVSINLANDRGFGDNKKTNFFTLVAWEKQAEFITTYLHKGSKVALTGELSYRQYEAQDGGKRSATEIVVREIVSLESKADSQNNAPASQNPAPAAQTQQRTQQPRQQSYQQSQAPQFEQIADDDELPF